MDVDTIIYAALAVALLGRLWFIFGRRNGNDPQRPNPFVTPAPMQEVKNDPKATASGAIANPYLQVKTLQIPPSSLAGRLEQIKALDPSFDEKAFLQGARTTFTMVVEDFAKGDLSRIERLLGPKVLPHFQNAIAARQKAGQSMESHVTRIRDAETTTAQADGTNASITVQFVSEQTNILRDSAGQVIGSAKGAVEQITDLWTFARDTAAASTDWILAETHS